MAFKMQQFKCKKCNFEFEELLDSRTPDEVIICPGEVLVSSHPDPKVLGTRLDRERCNSTDVELILAVSSSKGGHMSWSKWRV
jgi:hypothetical protein